jgi:serine/threonine protein kinase
VTERTGLIPTGPDVPRWFQETPSRYPWEQAGLDHIRTRMPGAEPFRAWATFSFTARSGRVHECDLFIATPGGLYLLELKGHPGQARNRGDLWIFRDEDSGYRGRLSNPLDLTNLKSMELRDRLQWAAGRVGYSGPLPRIEPAIFLSAPNLHTTFDEVQRTGVYGRDDCDTGLGWVWRDLLRRPPQRPSQRVGAELSRLLPAMMTEIGIRAASAHLRFGDGWTLDEEVLDYGPTWEDRLAARADGAVSEEGRLRIYLTALQATDEQRRSVERAARREYQMVQDVTHRGIAQAVQFGHHRGGPALLFRHRRSDLRLDAYLAEFSETLTLDTRLDMVRQLAEAVRYAHGRSLYHRALAARSVYVSAGEDGSAPVLRIIDWQAASREFDVPPPGSFGGSSLTGEHIEDAALVYLAPEFDRQQRPDPVGLDMFGLGALTYLLVTGQAPATDRGGLIDRITADGGLRPSAVLDGLTDGLDELVFEVTCGDTFQRLDSASRFLAKLDDVATHLSAAERSTLPVDPLTAVPGQAVDRDWIVERVLGTGATARVLLVTRTLTDEDGAEHTEQRVLKVALDASKEARLRAEARALDQVGGGMVIRLLDGPRRLADRLVLDLEYAGEHSLGRWLRERGRLSYHNLERFGGDVFTALDQLAAKGIHHRDLKPDNLGVFERADRSRQLMLFDFSLAEVSERDVRAGTRGYLDPFLGTARRPGFDDHAERYAAAVTLHEMASTERPVWGDGMTDPRTTTDEAPHLSVELFEPALRDGLTAFFRRAFHRDTEHRFDTYRQMEAAWRAIFREADAARPATSPETDHLTENGTNDESTSDERNRIAEAAGLDTPLVAAGLTERAISVAHGLGANTVAELLDIPQYKISKARGAGSLTRRELNRLHRQWSAALLGDRDAAAERTAERDSGTPTVDELAKQLVPATWRPAKKKEAVRLLLGLPGEDGVPEAWLSQAKVAARLDTTQVTVSRYLKDAVGRWADAEWLRPVRDELLGLVVAAGRVMTVDELTAALRARHGVEPGDPERSAARSLAVVRAAVEADIWAGEHPEHGAGDPATAGARLALPRRGGRVLAAAESLPGTDDPSVPELAGYAAALGVRADELAAADPLPGRAGVLRELRAVPAPAGLPPLADTRLVALAAAMSTRAAASPRLELYPRHLGLVRALRISQAAAGVRRETGISLPELLARVRARFPDIELPASPTYLVMESALGEAGFVLDYDTHARVFRPRGVERPRSASSTGTGPVVPGSAGLDPHQVLAGRLDASIRRGGFLALTLRGANLPGTPAALAGRYPVAAVDLARVFLTEFQALAGERGVEWSRVLAIEARYAETGQLTPGLRSYLGHVWPRVESRLLAAAGDTRVLFVHDAGLLARYYDAGGRELLSRLQNAARRPADHPHGLWLLCPAESSTTAPTLDGRTVEAIGTEQVVLDKAFLDMLKERAATAAGANG